MRQFVRQLGGGAVGGWPVSPVVCRSVRGSRQPESEGGRDAFPSVRLNAVAREVSNVPDSLRYRILVPKTNEVGNAVLALPREELRWKEGVVIAPARAIEPGDRSELGIHAASAGSESPLCGSVKRFQSGINLLPLERVECPFCQTRLVAVGLLSLERAKPYARRYGWELPREEPGSIVVSKASG